MNLKRAVITGFFDWLMPFAASLLLYPLLAYDRTLYSNLLSLFHLPVGILLLIIYSKGRALPVAESVSVTSLWVLINLVIDQPIFVFGPFKMSLYKYMTEIGMTYTSVIFLGLGAAMLYNRWSSTPLTSGRPSDVRS